ncbi:MAG: alpha/beta hydrolase [Candidatus Tectomicrobia bacterium]|nr:alpha/beta hydrolase [Candidatus Tectomicrobia bacterium]
MSREVIAEVMESSKGRMIGDGIHAADIDEILERCTGWGDWYEVVTGIGDRYERMAEERMSKGFKTSAGELLWRACMCYHYAQFYMFERPDLREAGQKKKVDLYRRAAPLFFPPAERVEIPFEGFSIPGYLRLPPGVKKPPCAILIGGLESTKEESFLFERMCHDRGLATFAFDGPGQGEMFFQTKMRPDFERFTSAVIDYLQKRPEIDPAKFGVLGRSLGGHYAPKSAAHDKRIAVCVCWGVLYELQTYWEDMHFLTRNGFTYCAGETDPAKGKETLKFIDLSGWAEKITCSLYLQHGRKDDLIPFHQAERLEREAVHAKEVVTQYEPEGNHCCHNLYHRTRHPMADHLAKVLAG